MDLMKLIYKWFEEYEHINAQIGTIIANKLYKQLPKDDLEFLKEIEPLIYCNDIRIFSIATNYLKKRKSILDLKYISMYEKWVKHTIHGWGECDQFCYRLTNPLLKKYPQIYDEYLLNWSDSDDFNMKRIALVTICGSSGTVAIDIEKVFYITDKMKFDEDILIQKAVGWVLKCCYKEYPNELVSYLKQNVDHLTRTTYRYTVRKNASQFKERINEFVT